MEAAAVNVYRHLSRGILPPPELWEASGVASLSPPAPLLPSPLLLASEARVHATVAHRSALRAAELRDVPSALPPALRLAAALERRLPSFAALQRRVRLDVSCAADACAEVMSAEASLALRRGRRQRLAREVRDAERGDRKRAADCEARRKRRREEFLAQLVSHHEEFVKFHREVRRAGTKLFKGVLADLDSKARRATKEKEKAQRERLKALKENNMEEYMKLVTDSKNERITQLLEETESYLRELGDKVEQQKRVLQHGSAAPEALAEEASVSTSEAAPPKPQESTDVYSEHSTYYRSAHTVEETISEQPRMLLGGQLKEYQMNGLRWLVSLHNNNLNGILADEMGLGKTIQTIALIAYLMETKKLAGPYLVIVPLAVLSNWQLECSRWIPDATTVAYKGSPDTRKDIYDSQLLERPNGGLDGSGLAFNILLTTYELVMKDKQRLRRFRYKYIIIDEGHRMKNAASKLSATLLQYDAERRVLLTGTPLQNSLHELWALLNFLLPKIFNSSETFEQWFSAPLAAAGADKCAEDLAMNEEESLLVINRLHQALRPFLLRRMKTEVEAQLPDKAEYVVKCELTGLQKMLYRQIQNQGLCTVGASGELKVSGLNNVEMQLRKVCNHPYLFFTREQRDEMTLQSEKAIWRSSGKFELLDRLLPKLKELGHRVLIFSQMVQLMDLLQLYLELTGYKFLRLDGGTKGDDRGELLRLFNEPNSPYFLFMLSTRAGGLGLNLQSADTVILFDSDWNPQIDLQAMARAHRIGQKQEVRVLRLVTASPIEEKILATANEKLDTEAKIIEAGKFNQTSTATDRREMLQRLLSQSADEMAEDGGIPTDEEINEMLCRPNEERGMTQEDELAFYNEMDARRRAEEARQAAREAPRGKAAPSAAEAEARSRSSRRTVRSLRLMDEDEVPDWLKRAEILAQERAAAPAADNLLSAPRERKNIHYRDDLSDRDWKRLMESGLDKETFLAREEERKRTLEEKKLAKSRGDGTPVAETDSEAADSAAGAKRLSTGGGGGKTKKPRASDGADVFLKLIKGVEGTQRLGRRIAGLFRQLPSEEEAPGYYEIVKKPISLGEMNEKARSGAYSSIDELDADMKLMVGNAHKYNEPQSQVYFDAELLLAAYHDLRSKYFGSS
ncbi:hypothetical protein AB1Y20_011893 [Prymnesium parvum]|uniref:Uncharacterized protein n=1 Tax=Prymnesium parvum TaxID=97485 RepID=A0AB34IIA7_PRYPA